MCDYLREWTRHYTLGLLYRDDPVDRRVLQHIYLAAWPVDFELIDMLHGAQSEVDPIVASRHVTRSAGGLLDLREIFACQLQHRTDPVTVGTRANELNLKPVVCISAVVPHQLGIVAAIIRDKIHITVIIV